MSNSSFRRALVAEAERLGLTDIRVEHGGKHPRLCFTFGGRSRFLVFSCSPSDGFHAVHKKIAELRRMVREVKA